jgi:hypothetical protein
MRAPNHGLDQVTELFCAELIPFQVGYQLPLAIDDSSVKRMGKLSFVRPETHPEQIAYALHVRNTPGKEVPVVRISFPNLGVVGQDFWAVVDGVEGYSEQNPISSQITACEAAKNEPRPLSRVTSSAQQTHDVFCSLSVRPSGKIARDL